MSTLVVKDLLFGRSQPLFEKPLSFSVDAGSALHIVGDNGAGKSTLLKTIAGLISEVDGEVLWGQESVSDARQEHPEDWVYLGHSEGVKLGLSAVENLYALVNLRRPIDIEACEQALVDVGLASVMYNAVMRLSAGQTRRVLLAQLLCLDCKIWLLDEPLAALDVKGREWLLSVARQYLANKGVLVYTSHQPLFENDAAHRELRLADYQ